MEEKPYLRIVRHVESCIETHGDTHRGVDWPNAEDVPVRHRVMLDVVREWPEDGRVRLLDFGCGASGLYEYILEEGIEADYSGLDISEKLIDLSRSKFPGNEYFCADLLESDVRLPRFDYVIANGVFTYKDELSFETMLDYFQRIIPRIFALAEVGLAFNVMSKHVDWERDDLFHLPFDVLATFLTAEVSRQFVFRTDYGLYEYTTYVYR